MISVTSEQTGDGRFIAWGKLGALTPGANAVTEVGEVWFDFDVTAKAAEAKVRAEIAKSLN